MELVWGNLKNTELANLCPDILDDADTAAHTGLHRIGSSYHSASRSSTTSTYDYDHHPKTERS